MKLAKYQSLNWNVSLNPSSIYKQLLITIIRYKKENLSMNEWMECLVSRQAVWQNAHLEFGEATPINKKPPVVLVLLDANAYV